MVRLVNVVGGGKVDFSLDLNKLSKLDNLIDVRYNPEVFAGLCFKFVQDGPTVILFSGGAYSIAGADSIDEINETRDTLIQLLEKEYERKICNVEFEIRNVLFVTEIEHELDLATLATGLGLNRTEYNPEQFPALYYRPENSPGTYLLFRTGKITLTGMDRPRLAEWSIIEFKQRIRQMVQ